MAEVPPEIKEPYCEESAQFKFKRMIKLIESSLVHKILPPRAKLLEANPTVILLHGRGANEDDLLGLSEYLDERLFTISVRAPYPFEWGGGFTWFDILEAGKPEPAMHAESYRRLMQFIADVTRGYPVDRSKVFLLGFSMGTMMSYTLALSHPELFRGVIANSGYIPEDAGIAYEWNKLNGLPFFIAHGTQDPIVPVQYGKRAVELLKATSARVEYHEYMMGHEISEEGLNDISLWLTRELDAK
jgi:phospholipase/carboxylesterase